MNLWRAVSYMKESPLTADWNCEAFVRFPRLPLAFPGGYSASDWRRAPTFLAPAFPVLVECKQTVVGGSAMRPRGILLLAVVYLLRGLVSNHVELYVDPDWGDQRSGMSHRRCKLNRLGIFIESMTLSWYQSDIGGWGIVVGTICITRNFDKCVRVCAMPKINNDFEKMYGNCCCNHSPHPVISDWTCQRTSGANHWIPLHRTWLRALGG